MKAAQAALARKKANPGDKASEIAAGEAMHRVKVLTAKEDKASLRDLQLKRKAEREIGRKVEGVRKSNELAKKRSVLKQEKAFAATHKAMKKKREEKDKLEREVQQAGHNLSIEKRIAKLAIIREKQRLERLTGRRKRGTRKIRLRRKRGTRKRRKKCVR